DCYRRIWRCGGRGVPPGARASSGDLTAAAAGFVAHSDFRAVDCDLDRVLLRADAGLCRTAVLSRKPVWVFGRRDRSFDHALADRGWLCGALCREAGRALSIRASRRNRSLAVLARSRRACMVAAASIG